MTLLLHDLSFERHYRFLFENISLGLNAGDCLQIVGPNGCGKSTLLRLIAGFIPAEKNTIIWQDQCLAEHRDSIQRQIHYIGHHSGIRAHLTVTENLTFYAALLNADNLDVRLLLTQVGLQHHETKLAADLSAGQRRRLALARLLMVERPWWILDEPLTALDQQGVELMRSLLATHCERGGIAILATHQIILPHSQTLELG